MSQLNVYQFHNYHLSNSLRTVFGTNGVTDNRPWFGLHGSIDSFYEQRHIILSEGNQFTFQVFKPTQIFFGIGQVLQRVKKMCRGSTAVKIPFFQLDLFFQWDREDKVRGYNSLQHIRKMIDNDTWFLCPISLTRGIYKTSSSALWETGVLHNNRSTEPMHRKTNTVGN